MNKILMLLAVALSCFIFTACGDEEDDVPGTGGAGQGVGNNTGETSVTGGVETLYITGAEVVGYLNVSDAVLMNTTFGIVYGTQSGVTIDNKLGNRSTTSLEGKEYKVTISELESDTKYYYRSYARIGSSYVYGAEKSFTTKGIKATAELTEQEGNTATFTCTTMLGEFDLLGGGNGYGLVWGTSADVSINSDKGFKSGNGLLNGTYTVGVNNLKYNTTYYYRAYTRTGSKYTFSEVQSFTTGEYAANVGKTVDLGLSVKWADMNVGASSPEDYGDYFAWGETEPKVSDGSSTYKWYNESSKTLTKYCTGVDNKTTLDPEDDAATVNWGAGWRMPTRAEQDELRDKCTWRWTTQAGVNGYSVKGPNGNSIFLPAAGCRIGPVLVDVGASCIYWSSSLTASHPNYAYYLYFDSSYNYRCDYYRSDGISVRPVCQ